MFDAKQLLGMLMQGGLSGSSSGRIDHALRAQGLDQATASGASGVGGVLGGLGGLAQSLLGGTGSSGRSAHPAAIGGLGALAGALLGGGGDSVKGALGGGAMALLGTLAYNALSNASEKQAVDAPAADLPVGLRAVATETDEQDMESVALLTLKAMINAAKADGEIDESETQRILGKLQEAGADAEAQAFVRDEMRRPLDTQALISGVPNAQVGAQVYAASLLAIAVDTPAERDYLTQLARGLGLQPEVVQNLHTALDV